MSYKSLGRPVLSLSLSASLLSIMILGGCPVPQTPSQTSTDTTTTDTTTTDQSNSNSSSTDRPVVVPPAQTGNGSSNGGSTGGGTGGGTTGGGTENNYSTSSSGAGFAQGGGAFLRLYEPFDARVVGASANITVTFYINYTSDITLSSADLVFAAADSSGQPSGDPLGAAGITVAKGDNTQTFNTSSVAGALQDNFGRYVIGIRLRTSTNVELKAYGQGVITVDAQAPTAAWVGANREGDALDQSDHLVNFDENWQVMVNTTDNAGSTHTLTVYLDPDNTNSNNTRSGDEVLFGAGSFTGSGTRTITKLLSDLGATAGAYYYWYEVTDGNSVTGAYAPGRLSVTNRLVGQYKLSRLDPNSNDYDNFGTSKGTIFQGFNYNDLAGSSIVSVADLDGDGSDEVIIGARFGKPYNESVAGVGFGEAYMLYGSTSRLRGVNSVSSIGNANFPGAQFPGVRRVLGQPWTYGLSDITVVPDMDGDGLPEIVFSFPRVENVSIGTPSGTGYQLQVLEPDVLGMGDAEYDAVDPMSGAWRANEAQFTRGGVVIVSSHNYLLQYRDEVNRKGDRLMDLSEVGQMFWSLDWEGYAPYKLYVREAEKADTQQTFDCSTLNPPGPAALAYNIWTVRWDVILANQGAMGFGNRFNSCDYVDPASGCAYEATHVKDSYRTPLANPRYMPWDIVADIGLMLPPQTLDKDHICPTECELTNEWFHWADCPGAMAGTISCGLDSWSEFDVSHGEMVWTGFYGGYKGVWPLDGNQIGARILGQRREDWFGASVGTDGHFLYMSAPRRTVRALDVPALGTDRTECGVVYRYRTDSRLGGAGSPTQSQLWIEPYLEEDPKHPGVQRFVRYPNVDKELPGRTDYTVPTPHQYIIKDIGSLRGYDAYFTGSGSTAIAAGADAPENAAILGDYKFTKPSDWQCKSVIANFPAAVTGSVVGGMPPAGFANLTPGEAAYYVRTATQIVGPHDDAHLSFVRGLSDVNGDGFPDVAVGSADILKDVSSNPPPNNPVVGAVFIVYGRPLGAEGDYLLDKMALPPSDPERLRGLMLRGNSPGEGLGRVFDDAGDFDGSGVADILVGASGYDSDRGQAIVILGSAQLDSPAGGWTVDTLLAANNGVRFVGEHQGDMAGGNVAAAGDVDGDGLADILVAAPGAPGPNGELNVGAVYLIYGQHNMRGKSFNLSQVGTVDLPGVKFIGRAGGDFLGGGIKNFAQDALNPPDTGYSREVNAYSRGVTKLGDIDHDGKDDYALGAMLASPNGRVNSGEIYILYGRGD